jgi:1-deoxy-D-xylulose-5-phosphate reductoisomerase
MKLPIQYALTFPQRLTNEFPRFSFADFPAFTFEKPDLETFPCLSLAYHASKEGGNKPCVLNAANEVAVAQFLSGKIKFTNVPKIIEKALGDIPFFHPKSIEEYLEVDEEVRGKYAGL